jgi:hypothetical protein
MTSSILHIKSQLETLRDEMEASGNLMYDWLKGDEKSEDIAAVARIMTEVSALLQNCIGSFFHGWDFTEDCRRGRLAAEKEAVKAAQAASG